MTDKNNHHHRCKDQSQSETDIRVYEKRAIQWKGNGTYYFLTGHNVWCRVSCIEVLDIEMEKGSQFKYITEESVKEVN